MTEAQMRRLKPGMVIRSPWGRERTVYDVRRKGCRVSVSVPILRCSWTHRGYTVLDKHMLRSYRLTRKRKQLRRTKVGRLLFQECQGHGKTAERFCDCCDVIGVLE